MIKWLAYLLATPLLTPSERQVLKLYYQQQRRAFIARHIIADAPPCVLELEAQLDLTDDIQARAVEIFREKVDGRSITELGSHAAGRMQEAALEQAEEEFGVKYNVNSNSYERISNVDQK